MNITAARLRAATGCAVAALFLALSGPPAPATAQSLFAPAIRVNQDVVTYYELDQRELLLRLIGSPGDPVKQAREDLINDRLREPVLAEAGIELAAEDIEAGMEEMAQRANLTLDEFIKGLEDGGVSRETFRDFVRVNLAWREYIQNTYLARARPTDAEIDRAIGQEGSGGGVRVLLSEIIIPITPQTLDAIEAEAERISQLRSFAAFSEEAARFSATETRDNGGRMDWISINNLPPALRPVILALSPGEVTSPIPLPNAVALFQMRDIAEAGVPTPRYSQIDYAILRIAGGRSEAALQYAAQVRDRVDRCNDLYGVAQGQPPEVLERRSEAPAKIPRDIALELAKLDDGEVSIALTNRDGSQLLLLMMCGRVAAVNDDTTREQLALALTQQRLNAFAQSDLAQLRAEAIITDVR